jgi:hypothetical protein
LDASWLLVGKVLVVPVLNRPFTTPLVLRSACKGGLSTSLFPSGPGDGGG